MQYFLKAMSHFADFTGRATRTEYWMFVLFNIIIAFVLGIIGGILGTAILSGLFSLAVLIPSFSVAARRLHDTGRTGWWQLIALIPLIGLIILIVFLVQDSHDDNQYGPNPKA